MAARRAKYRILSMTKQARRENHMHAENSRRFKPRLTLRTHAVADRKLFAPIFNR
jgi:hypothetical protein